MNMEPFTRSIAMRPAAHAGAAAITMCPMARLLSRRMRRACSSAPRYVSSQRNFAAPAVGAKLTVAPNDTDAVKRAPWAKAKEQASDGDEPTSQRSGNARVLKSSPASSSSSSDKETERFKGVLSKVSKPDTNLYKGAIRQTSSLDELLELMQPGVPDGAMTLAAVRALALVLELSAQDQAAETPASQPAAQKESPAQATLSQPAAQAKSQLPLTRSTLEQLQAAASAAAAAAAAFKLAEASFEELLRQADAAAQKADAAAEAATASAAVARLGTASVTLAAADAASTASATSKAAMELLQAAATKTSQVSGVATAYGNAATAVAEARRMAEALSPPGSGPPGPAPERPAAAETSVVPATASHAEQPTADDKPSPRRTSPLALLRQLSTLYLLLQLCLQHLLEPWAPSSAASASRERGEDQGSGSDSGSASRASAASQVTPRSTEALLALLLGLAEVRHLMNAHDKPPKEVFSVRKRLLGLFKDKKALSAVAVCKYPYLKGSPLAPIASAACEMHEFLQSRSLQVPWLKQQCWFDQEDQRKLRLEVAQRMCKHYVLAAPVQADS